MKGKTGEMQIRIGNDLKPIFSNFANISHKDDEFTLTFCHIFPVPGSKGLVKGTTEAIVTVTPKHAKRFLNALLDNIRKYEQKFGEITLLEDRKNVKKDLYI